MKSCAGLSGQPYRAPAHKADGTTPTHKVGVGTSWARWDFIHQWRCVRPGRAEGRLIGGNLNTLYGFLASPYFPALRQGDILLLEDGLKDAATVEKNFAMLKLAGAFDKAGAVLLGKRERFDDCGTGRLPSDILLEILDGQPLPILADFDCGHTLPQLTLPIGARVRVDAAARSVEVLEDWRTLV